MLTVDLDRLGVSRGDRVLDLGCGRGRHAFALSRRGATVVALDADPAELRSVQAMHAAMVDAGEVDARGATAVRADAGDLPFATASFDHVVAAEVVEHLWADERALRELARVLRPGGSLAVTVPSYLPERVCWALSDQYHHAPGGHVRVYRRRTLEHRVQRAGFVVRGAARAHALHAPYWWMRCAVGIEHEPWVVRRYHDALVWQIEHRPRWLERVEGALDPVLGKSLVLYASRP